MKNKDSAPKTICDNQVQLETESTALKSFVVGQFFLIKKSIQEIKDPNHEVTNSPQTEVLSQISGVNDNNIPQCC